MNHDIAFTRSTMLTSSALDIVSACSLKALFWRPKFLRADPVLCHTPFLFWLTEALQPKVVVDLGTGSGVAHFAFCQAAEKLGLDARCIGIDAWRTGLSRDAEQYNATHYGEFGRLVQCDPAQAHDQFADGSVDLLNIRLPEDEAAFLTLLRQWLPKLSESAVLIVQGVRGQAWNVAGRTLLKGPDAEYPGIRFDHGQGLAAFLVGKAQPERVLKLAALKFGQVGYADVQNIFRRLGTAAQLEWQSHSDAEHVATLQAQVTELQQQRPGDEVPHLLETLALVNRALAEAAERNIRQAEELASLQARLAAPGNAAQIRLREIEGELKLCLQAKRDLMVQNSQVSAELTEARIQAGEAALHVQALLGSTCWKITAPARRLVLLMRHLRDRRAAC